MNSSDRIGNREKAILHIAKAELGLSDEIYRDVLRNIAGVKSSVDLDRKGYSAVLDNFEAKGFRIRYKNRKGERNDPSRGKEKYDDLWGRPGFANPKQLRLIETLWWEVTRSKNPHKALRAFIYRMVRVSDIRMIEEDQAPIIIEAIKAMKNRKMYQEAERRREEREEAQASMTVQPALL